jgi:hypothetical protein
MVTFSTRDTSEELDRKFKLKRNDDRIEVINSELFANEEQAYICDCGATMQYDKIQSACWCNTCVRWYQPNNAKKAVVFEIPVKQEDSTPLVSCGDTPTIEPNKVEVKGAFAELQRRGIRLTSYEEYNP